MAGFETAVAAIEIVKVTIKIIRIGHTLLSDIKHYGTDARKLGLKFQQNFHCYDSLQKVLFEAKKFPFLQGKKLFEVLPDQSQTIVTQLLLELLRLLYAHFALEQKYAVSSEASQSSSGFEKHLGLTADEEKIVFHGTTAGNDIELHTRSQLMSVTGWSWAIRGKIKAVRLNTEFEDWLKRTKAVLEDTWWPLPAFNVLANLETLQTDSDARTAGLAASAGLRRLVIDKTNLPEALNTPWESVKQTKILPSGKMVGVFGDSSVLVETFTFPLDQDGNLADIFEERFSKIVRLLSSQKDPDFRVLHCLKYSSQISEASGKVRLISQILDPETTPTIRTLADVFRGIKSDQRPSLGLRFSMCHQLADSLFLLHSVDWVHRALRSDNVLIIFPNDDLDKTALKRAELRVCGFETSRPATDSSLGPYDNQLSRNVYRHPKRWGTPRELFTQVHDVYSLGVILLEIGLWERAEDMISSLKPEQRVPGPVSQYLLRHANERLEHRCGEVFANAVRKCLALNFDEDSDEASIANLSELERQQKIHRGLLEHVVDPLKVLKDVV
jgi:serine/threonine protein kinase